MCVYESRLMKRVACRYKDNENISNESDSDIEKFAENS